MVHAIKVRLHTVLLFLSVLLVPYREGRCQLPTVKIAGVEWSSVNLKTDRFLNGDIIPEAKTPMEWIMISKKGLPVRMISGNGEVFYNWHAVTDPRGIAPKGFRVPSMLDWYNLLDSQITQKLPIRSFLSASGWYDNKNGTNAFGFNAKPEGRVSLEGYREEGGRFARYWCTTDANGSMAYYADFSPDKTNLKLGTDYKRCGFQLRLIKIPPQTKIGEYSYSTARIGTYEWMTENFKEDVFFGSSLDVSRANSLDEWNELIRKKSPAWAYYRFDPAQAHRGKFYNIYLLELIDRFSFDGWQVPSLTHWEDLVKAVGGWTGTAAKLRGGPEWSNGAVVSNESGFNALPVGLLTGGLGSFDDPGNAAVWWVNDDAVNLLGILSETDDIIRARQGDLDFSVLQAGVPLRLVKADRETHPYSQLRGAEKTWENESGREELDQLRKFSAGNELYKKYPIILECLLANLKATHTHEEFRYMPESDMFQVFRELVVQCSLIHKINLTNK